LRRLGQQLSQSVAVTLRSAALRLTPSPAAMRVILRHHGWVVPRLALGGSMSTGRAAAGSVGAWRVNMPCFHREKTEVS